MRLGVLLYRPSKFKLVTLDSLFGTCIIALYYLYLTLVRGMLSVFDCSRAPGGDYLLDADPSIKCNQVLEEALVCGIAVRMAVRAVYAPRWLL